MLREFQSCAFKTPQEYKNMVGCMKNMLLYVTLPSVAAALLFSQLLFPLALLFALIVLFTGPWGLLVILYQVRVGNEERLEKFKDSYFIRFTDTRIYYSRPMVLGTNWFDNGNYSREKGIYVATYSIPYSSITKIELEDYSPSSPDRNRPAKYKIMKIKTDLYKDPFIIFPTHFTKEFMEYFIGRFGDKMVYKVPLESLEPLYGHDRVTPSLV